MRTGQQVADQVAQDQPADRRELIGGQQSPAYRRRWGLGDVYRDDHHGDADGQAKQQSCRQQHRHRHRDRTQQRECRVADDDQDHRLLTADRIGERTADQRTADLADHHHRRQQLLLPRRQAELVGNEQQRAGDAGQVVPVNDTDARRSEPGQQASPRWARRLTDGQLGRTRSRSTAMTCSGLSGVMHGRTRPRPTCRTSMVRLLPRWMSSGNQ